MYTVSSSYAFTAPDDQRSGHRDKDLGRSGALGSWLAAVKSAFGAWNPPGYAATENPPDWVAKPGICPFCAAKAY